jgi:glucose dehydrogenase
VEDPSKRTRQGVNTMNICPAAMGAKNQQPVSYSPRTKLIYAGTNNLCMNYEGVEVQYVAGAPYVGANVRIFPVPGGFQGEFMAWGSGHGEEGVEHQGAVPGVDRHSDDRRRRVVLRHDGRLVQGRELEDRRAALEG